MAHIPRDRSPDSSLALLSEGYRFISRRRDRYGSDLFRARLMLRKAYCATGEDAARMFYHPERFTRKRAMPPTTLMLLQDFGSVQLLDGEAHRVRKQMFMSLMGPGGLQRMAEAAADRWREAIERWEGMDEVVLFHEVEGILCRAACDWAGVPLPESEARQRTREFSAMIDGAGAVGPRNWRGMLLRSRTERWMRGVVERVRSGEIDVPEGSAAEVIARHRDPDGEPLDTRVAAVELLNVLRPTVAVARYVAFAALALHDHPECRQRLAEEDDYLEHFVQEVRRFYPFFPLVAGRARTEFEWREHRFAEGDWVLLDIYGTNRDPRSWEEPEAFRPERFRGREGSAFDLIPQGGGDHHRGHRCAGEWLTIDLVKTAVRMLTTRMRYDVPDQDLGIDLSRMPAIPESRFVISNVRRVE